MRHITKNHVIMGILLILILLMNMHYLQMKSGYFVDEGMTLFLSNGNYNGAVTSRSDSSLQDFMDEFVFKENLPATVNNVFAMLRELTTAGNYSAEGTVAWYDAARSLLQGKRMWIDGEELFDQLVASKGERFRYIQVYLNQAMDVHPPLYYLLVHTVFSLFPDSYSDAYLFAVNIMALLLTCVVLWKMGRLFSDDLCLPVLAVVIFGFSQGFVSCAMYFRMYAVFALFTALTVYLHLLMGRREYHINRKMSWALTGSVVLGFYTHYYYVIFLFPLFVMTVIKLISKKRKSELRFYIRSMIAAGVISLVIWPLSIYHILFGYRGTEAVSNLMADGLITGIKNYYQILRQAFFYNSSLLIFLILLMGCAAAIIKLKDKKFNVQIIEMTAACFFYLLIVSQIAPSRADRYIMCIYPVIAFLIAMPVAEMVRLSAGYKKIYIIILTGISGMVIISSWSVISPNYLYLEKRDYKLGVEQEKSEMNCMMLSDDDWRGFPEALRLTGFRQVIVLGEGELSVLTEEKPKDLKCDMIIYVLDELEQESILKQSCEPLGYSYNQAESVSSDIEGFHAYLFKMEGADT